MNIDDIIQLAAEAKAAELIQQIESGELTYDAVIAGLYHPREGAT